MTAKLLSVFSARIATGVYISFCVYALAGCNHLFYQPDRVEYLHVKDVKHRSVRLTISYGEHSLGAWRIFTPHRAKALVVQAHGNAQNLTAHMSMLGYFLDHGFDVLGFDYQGYGTSSGSPTRAGTVNDTIAAIDFAFRSEPTLPVILLGQSLGGAISVTALHQSAVQSMVKLLILDSTFANYRSIARRKLGSFWLTWLLQYPLSLLISDYLSPAQFGAELTLPILQVHAKEDPVVPFVEGEVLFRTFANARDRTFVAFAGESHTAGFSLPVPEVDQAFQGITRRLGMD